MLLPRVFISARTFQKAGAFRWIRIWIACASLGRGNLPPKKHGPMLCGWGHLGITRTELQTNAPKNQPRCTTVILWMAANSISRHHSETLECFDYPNVNNYPTNVLETHGFFSARWISRNQPQYTAKATPKRPHRLPRPVGRPGDFLGPGRGTRTHFDTSCRAVTIAGPAPVAEVPCKKQQNNMSMFMQ